MQGGRNDVWRLSRIDSRLLGDTRPISAHILPRAIGIAVHTVAASVLPECSQHGPAAIAIRALARYCMGAAR